MSYTLEQLSAEIRNALKADSGVAGKQAVCKLGNLPPVRLGGTECLAKHGRDIGRAEQRGCDRIGP